MRRILMIGLTGKGVLGGYETQLGNVAILIPAFKLFKKYIPDAEIWTTIQLTDKFCAEHGVIRIPNPKRISPTILRMAIRVLTTLFDFFRASLWRLIYDVFKVNFRPIIKGKSLELFTSADVVLDFNGDIFPSDLPPLLVFLHAVEVVTVRQLRIPVVEFISSPGPFNTWFRRSISRFMYKRISLFSNREPVSSKLVKQLGIDRPIVCAACPALLLEPAPVKVSRQLLARENVDVNVRPLIGFTLAGYNLKSQRTWGQPKHFEDLRLYIPILKYLLEDLKGNVFLLPHVYRMNPYTYGKEHINGPDYDILLNLFKAIEGENYNGRLRLIEGKYTPSEAKGIIGQCDLYISGRVHAGAAAMSQGIPTVMLSYGHKHRGFAQLYHQERFAYQGNSPEELKALVQNAWEDREDLRKAICERMARVEELVNLNFEIVKGIVVLNKNERNSIPKELTDAWVMRGEE